MRAITWRHFEPLLDSEHYSKCLEESKMLIDTWQASLEKSRMKERWNIITSANLYAISNSPLSVQNLKKGTSIMWIIKALWNSFHLHWFRKYVGYKKINIHNHSYRSKMFEFFTLINVGVLFGLHGEFLQLFQCRKCG